MPTEIILSRCGPETWIAVKEAGRVVEILVDRDRRRSLVGNVYRGRVTRVMRGMHAAFVDIGLDRDAFLYAGDMPGAASPPAVPSPDDEGDDGADSTPAKAPPDIGRLVRSGQDLLVQVSKDPLGTKGARVTGVLALAGRSVVLLPRVEHVGISRRIADPAERDRLRALAQPLRPAGGGLIVRTAAEGAGSGTLDAEVAGLLEAWRSIEARAAAAPVPSLIRRELDLPLKLLRDHAGPDLERVRVDAQDLAEACRELLRGSAPELVDRVTLHRGTTSLLDEAGVSAVAESALKAKVWLESGGYLVIQPTEALVSIDVNTGRYVGRKDLEDTALRTNLEAAREVARQVRLRGLGGIIVVDFIDMALEESRRRLLEEVERALAGDRTRSRLLGLTEFGLLVLTRKRTRPSLERSLCRPCPYCSGRGRVRGASTVAGLVARALRRQAPRGGSLRLRVHPEVADELRGPAGWLEGSPRAVVIQADPEIHREAFELTEEPL